MTITDLSCSVDPCKVTEVRVCGNTNDITVDRLEMLDVVTECYDLRWTYKCANIQHPLMTMQHLMLT